MKSDRTRQKVMAFLAERGVKDSTDLRGGGFSATDLRGAKSGATALLCAGFSATDLRGAGFSVTDLQEWDSIPILEKPYSLLLADIESQRRIHSQKDWGPDYDPARNLCKTEMCTAGHLVNMAGEVGYKLQKKYGWEIAATLIHRKSRPDVPPQNFGAIPQELAMAYIRERAAEEEKA